MAFTGPLRDEYLATLKDELTAPETAPKYAGATTAEQKRDLYNGLTEPGPVPLAVVRDYLDEKLHAGTSAPEFQISENVRRLADQVAPFQYTQNVAANDQNVYEQWVSSAKTWVALLLDVVRSAGSASPIDVTTGESVKILADLVSANCLSTAQEAEIKALANNVTLEELGRQLRVGETLPGRRSRNQIRGTPPATTQDVLDAEALP